VGYVTQWVLRNGDAFKVADSVPSGWEQPSFVDSAWRTQVSPFAYTSLSPLGQPQYYYPGFLNERALGPGPDDVVQIGSQYGGMVSASTAATPPEADWAFTSGPTGTGASETITWKYTGSNLAPSGRWDVSRSVIFEYQIAGQYTRTSGGAPPVSGGPGNYSWSMTVPVSGAGPIGWFRVYAYDWLAGVEVPVLSWGTAYDPPAQAPSQLWFRRSVTVPKTGIYRFVGFGDNDLALYWDGSLIMQNHYFGTANFDREIDLVAGTHLLAGQITGDTSYDGVGFAIFWDEPIVQDIADGPASRIVRYY
jgi:hypothetical protein